MNEIQLCAYFACNMEPRCGDSGVDWDACPLPRLDSNDNTVKGTKTGQVGKHVNCSSLDFVLEVARRSAQSTV